MEKDLSDYRKSYTKQELRVSEVPENPLKLFQKWFDAVEASKTVEEANAMSVATVGKDGFPKTRIVLLKQLTKEGFVFYTNYDSEKGKAIANNPQVCLSFFWPEMEQQVIIKGIAEKVSGEVSDTYFASRPKGSQLGAWASPQSTVVPSKDKLIDNLKQYEASFGSKDIPRPKHWGGFVVKPLSIEFWQGRPNRMHDRIRFSLKKDCSWKIERLAP
ncbi:MAG: pyridoxamine 5'-phosphate oxidase [Flavicella sp.]